MPDTRYIVSTNPARLDLPWVKAMLRASYWGERLTDEQIEGSIRNSLCFGLYAISRTLPSPKQVGFARVVTDWHTFSSVMDVIVDPEYRGQGLGAKLIAEVSQHRAVACTISLLATRYASTLYERFGWHSSRQNIMVRNPDA